MALKNLTFPTGGDNALIGANNLTLAPTTYTTAAGGAAAIRGDMTAGTAGRYRIANDAVEGYVVWVGHGALPDLTDDPDGFAAALPIDVTVTPPGSGTLDLFVITRRRNKYGLVSQNQQAKVITIDSSGDEALGDLSAPEIIDVTTGADDAFHLWFRYPGLAADPNPADTYRVYVKKGAAPTPGVDTPAATGAATATGAVVVGPYADGGATYHFAVTVYRTADTAESTADTTTLELDADPDTPTPLAGGFGAGA